MKSVLRLSVAMIMVAAALYSLDHSASEKRELRRMLMRQLHTLPRWAVLSEYDQRNRQSLLGDLLRIARYDTATLRDVVKDEVLFCETLGTYDSQMEHYNIFVLNRLCFDIPPTSFQPVGGFTSREDFRNNARGFWPIEVTGKETLRLAGVIDGRFGVPFDGLNDFDNLDASYSRRNLNDVRVEIKSPDEHVGVRVSGPSAELDHDTGTHKSRYKSDLLSRGPIADTD